MSRRDRNYLLGIVASLVVGSLVAWAGSDGSVEVGSVPVFALCGALAYVVNWVAFVPSYVARTEQYFDLMGSVTYLSVVGAALLLSSDLDARAVVVALLVAVWAVRLGSFLFMRIRRDGGDGRFDKIKQSFLNFLMVWTIQGLWVFLTVACALAVITAEDRSDFGWVAALGVVIWVGGFAIEVTADRQKSAFRADPANQGRFIDVGLWAWSRHPNYFGEIMLWTGIAVIALPVLSGWRWLMLISPVFVYVLLTRISGVPMLEARARKRWGDQEDFRAYTERTPVLMLRPPRN